MEHTIVHRMTDVFRHGSHRVTSRFGSRRPRPAARTRPSSGGIDLVDDPDGSMRLVRVRGVLSWRSIDRLFDLLVEPMSIRGVHLDLIDARILDVPTMMRLERLVDCLEQRQVGVRIIGIDPAHPALMH